MINMFINNVARKEVDVHKEQSEFNIHSSLWEVLEKDWWIKTEHENSTAQNYVMGYKTS